METIDLPQDEAVPLKSLPADIIGLRIVFVNVYAIGDRSGWCLIDAGLSGSAGRILRWCAAHFGDTAPGAILLTHAHFDHVGALETLVDTWGVRVYAHPRELPYVKGERAYPPPDPSVGGGLMARMAALYPRKPINLGAVARALPADGSITDAPGWKWIHTPGHTPGHVSLFRASDRVLVVGDAFCTTKQESFLAVATQRPELHGPPAYFTTDWDAARQSVRRLAALQPDVIAPGHGQAMSGDETMRALDTLSQRFDELARPKQGRYVEHPVSE